LGTGFPVFFRFFRFFKEFFPPVEAISRRKPYYTYGYACLYASFNKVSINDLTLTFVGSRYPRTLLAHLTRVRGFTVAEQSPGIYTVTGDIIPIQIIDNRRLSEAENLWLRDLDNKLGVSEINRISREVGRLGKGVRAGAYLDVVGRANSKKLKEAFRMSKRLTLEQVFEDVGLTAKWEARARAAEQEESKKKLKERICEIAQNFIKVGIPLEKVAEATGLDLKTVKSLKKSAKVAKA
jgi:hypothetical protein